MIRKKRGGARWLCVGFFHIDVNSAFLSWSAADHLLMGGTTDYRTIHAAVARPSKDGRGIILAKSESAKKLGVITGGAYLDGKRKMPGSLSCAT